MLFICVDFSDFQVWRPWIVFQVSFVIVFFLTELTRICRLFNVEKEQAKKVH